MIFNINYQQPEINFSVIFSMLLYKAIFIMSILKSTHSGSYFPITINELKRHGYWYNCTIATTCDAIEKYTKILRKETFTCTYNIYYNSQKNEFYTIIRKCFAPIRLIIHSENDLNVFECYYESVTTGKNTTEMKKQLYKTFNI